MKSLEINKLENKEIIKVSQNGIRQLIGEKKWGDWKKQVERWDYCENCYEEKNNSELKHLAKQYVGFSRNAWANVGKWSLEHYCSECLTKIDLDKVQGIYKIYTQIEF